MVKTSDTRFGFEKAIHLVKDGRKASRMGWNGSNQYIELATDVSFKKPDGTVLEANHEAMGNNAIAFYGTSGIQIGWLASQADMLANDWIEIEE